MTRADQALLAARALLAVVLIYGVTYLLRVQGLAVDEGGGLFALGFLLLAGTAFGRLAHLIGLPRLTGYLFAGLLTGPSGFAVFGEGQVQNLSLINGLALALIALQAGCEFTREMLIKNLRSLSWATASHLFVIVLGTMAVFYLMAPYLGLKGVVGTGMLLAIGAVWGAIAASKSPAAVVAVLGETGAKGPLSEHALGIVVVLDVVVLVLFSFALMFARTFLDTEAVFSWLEVQHLGVELIASVAAGTTFGVLIAFYFWLIGREKLLFILATAYGITAFCRFFNFDTMLVFVVAGFVVTNFSRQGKTMIHTIESASSTVMIVFFATAGASLHLEELRHLWQVVLVLAGSRVLLTYLAVRVGNRLAKDPPVLRKYGFSPFISQAGLTIGLAVIMRDQLPGVGPTLATLAISMVALNEVVGPVIFKWGLQRAGEVNPALESAAFQSLAVSSDDETPK